MLKETIKKIDKYFGDGERWHEYGVVCFFGVIMGSIMSMFPFTIVFIFFTVIKFGLSIYQEIFVERKGHLTKENVTRDFWYDILIRPVGSCLIAFGFFYPSLVFAAIVLTYKFNFWSK